LRSCNADSAPWPVERGRNLQAPQTQRDVDFDGGRQGLTMREVVMAAKPFS